MVSRRKILSRSRDDLNLEAPPQEEEEDIWYNKDKLYKVRTIRRHIRSVVALILRWRPERASVTLLFWLSQGSRYRKRRN